MSDTPPGWYPDAQGTTRWFDGTNWTAHTRAVAPPSSPPTGQRAAWPAASPMSLQPYGTPGPAGRSKGLLIGLGALGVLLIAGIVVTLVLLARGGDDENAVSDTPTASDSSTTDSSTTDPTGTPTTDEPPVDPDPAGSPGQTASAFMKAIFSGDCKAAEKLVTQVLLANEGSCANTEFPPELFDQVDFKIGHAQVDGDTAVVPVNIVVDGGDTGSIPGGRVTLDMVRQGGEWKISKLDAPAQPGS